MTAYIIQTAVGLALGLEGQGSFKNNPVLRQLLPEFPWDNRAMTAKQPYMQRAPSAILLTLL